MTRFLITLGLILTLAFAAPAEAKKSKKSKTKKKEPKVTVEKLCSDFAVNNQSVKTPSANYVEGVDINGNPVAPADIPSENSSLAKSVIGKNVKIPVTIDLASKLSSSLHDIELKPNMGNIEIFADGHAEWNGTDISSDLKTFCKDQQKGKKSTSADDMMPMPPSLDGAPTSGNTMRGSRPSFNGGLPLPATVSPSLTRTE